MEALRDMVERLMVTRAVAVAKHMLPPATGRNPSLSKAQLDGFCRVVVESYMKQRRVARVAGVGLAAAAITLAGFGVHRFNTSNGRDD